MKVAATARGPDLASPLEPRDGCRACLVIAMPVPEGRLCDKSFVFCRVAVLSRRILKSWQLEAPAHGPGVVPRWLRDQGVDVVIVGGIGLRARQLLVEMGIHVLVGAPAKSPESLLCDFLHGELLLGENCCDHQTRDGSCERSGNSAPPIDAGSVAHVWASIRG